MVLPESRSLLHNVVGENVILGIFVAINLFLLFSESWEESAIAI